MMDVNGLKALIAFYNQTYHGMTMAAGLRSIGSVFKIDIRLANNMLGHVEVIISSVTNLPADQKLLQAWEHVRDWLKVPRHGIIDTDHSSDIYQLNALAYLTWAELCNYSGARHFAEENYTVFAHPDQHPGIGAIRQMWTAHAAAATSPEPATLKNLAALLARIGRADEADLEGPDRGNNPPAAKP